MFLNVFLGICLNTTTKKKKIKQNTTNQLMKKKKKIKNLPNTKCFFFFLFLILKNTIVSITLWKSNFQLIKIQNNEKKNKLPNWSEK